MTKLSLLAASLLLAEEKKVTIEEARVLLQDLSFKEYYNLVEAGVSITPPSGQTIGPTTTGQQNLGQQNTATSNAAKQPSQVKAIWPGKGSPVQMGMTVGLKGPNGLPVPGQVTQVDTASKGVKVRNPTTGQTEWMNTDTLEPFMAGGAGSGANAQPAQQVLQPVQQQATEDVDTLNRMRKLAGIEEDASCGGTSAGSIAVTPVSLGKVKRRSSPVEEVKKEYVPKMAPKTIVGDTKPNQASGELSATLSANGKKTANRINNGFKK